MWIAESLKRAFTGAIDIRALIPSVFTISLINDAIQDVEKRASYIFLIAFEDASKQQRYKFIV